MAKIPQLLLFSWKEIEELGDLSRLKLLIDHLPDEKLMQQLESARGNGRDDYPIRAMWNSLLAGIVFQHSSVESLRRELSRNGQLRMVCGFDPVRGDRQVPASWVYSRFSRLRTLEKHAEEVDAIFQRVLWQVAAELPDLGRSLAVDGKAVASSARKPGRGYDDTKLHRRLWDNHGIKPVIGIRNLWKAPEGHDATCAVKSLEGVAYDFEGKVYCYNAYGHRHKMAHGGFEKDRNTIKYRCPAEHYGQHCSGRSQCRIGKSVRIPIEEDRRVFGPVARDSYKWKDLNKRRTAVERVYSRLDVSFGFENHTIRGLNKMRLRVGMAYMAMLALALGRIKENKAELMRSLVKAA